MKSRIRQVVRDLYLFINNSSKAFNDINQKLEQKDEEMQQLKNMLCNHLHEQKLLREDYTTLFNIACTTEFKTEKILFNAVPDSFNYFDTYKEYHELLKIFTEKNSKNNYMDITRFYMFLLNIQAVLNRKIKGAFAELGVYKGNNSAIMLHYCTKEKRKLYMFDTFEGFDRRDLEGVDQNQGLQFADTSLESVMEFVGENEYTRYIRGYFPQSITEESANETYAFVSLDCDLYNPIKNGLEFFYPRMSLGGMIFIHDYSSGYFKGCTKAVDEFCREKQAFVVLMPDKSGTAVLVKQS